jgi:hypothetical protein
MRLLAKYLDIPRQAEAEAGASADDVVIPPVDPAAAAAEPGAAAAEGGEAGAGETPPDPAAAAAAAAAEKAHGNAGKRPWFMDRINEETNAKQAERQRAEAAERERDHFRTLAERLQSGEKPPAGEAQPQPGAPLKPTSVTTRPAQGDPIFSEAVKAEAAQQRFFEDTLAVKDAGLAAFPNFAQSLEILTAVGATNSDVVQDIFAVDKANAHVMLDRLAKDPDKAAALVAMDSRRRIAELTRMTMTEAPKTAAAVVPGAKISKAPPPKPVIEGGGGGQVDPLEDLEDKTSDDAFSKAWDKKYLKRA